MSYLVLARKYRPKKFQDLLGQEVIAQTLLNALKQDRAAHAFLFTGPRGVGKTSCARILTSALNCLNPVDFEPCGECNLCKDIAENICTDVFEVDAASNRGIDHIRDLKENCFYPPANAKFKIYIIDEVHMLTTESFNALLKTLEEPPPYVKFILATTDSQKIPATVISRCQRYDFRPFTFQVMVDYLKYISSTENIEISEKALHRIVRDAKGGMRDALTSMDMLIAFCGNRIEDGQVSQILGVNDPHLLLEFLRQIVAKDSAGALKMFDDWLQSGISLTKILGDLLEVLRNLCLVQKIPASDPYWKDHLPELIQEMEAFSRTISLSLLNRYFDILLDAETEIRRSEFSRMCFEMAILKMSQANQVVGIKQLLTELKKPGSPASNQKNIRREQSGSAGGTHATPIQNQQSAQNQQSVQENSGNSGSVHSQQSVKENSDPISTTEELSAVEKQTEKETPAENLSASVEEKSTSNVSREKSEQTGFSQTPGVLEETGAKYKTNLAEKNLTETNVSMPENQNASDAEKKIVPEKNSAELKESTESRSFPEKNSASELKESTESRSFPEKNSAELKESTESRSFPEKNSASELKESTESRSFPEKNSAELKESTESPSLPEKNSASELKESTESPSFPEKNSTESTRPDPVEQPQDIRFKANEAKSPTLPEREKSNSPASFPGEISDMPSQPEYFFSDPNFFASQSPEPFSGSSPGPDFHSAPAKSPLPQSEPPVSSEKPDITQNSAKEISDSLRTNLEKMSEFLQASESFGEARLSAVLKRVEPEEFSDRHLSVVCSSEEDFRWLNEKKRAKVEEMLSTRFNPGFTFHCRLESGRSIQTVFILEMAQKQQDQKEHHEKVMNSDLVKSIRNVFPQGKIQFVPTD